MSKENFKNRGITLIALIITIIVMLILTGVTLSITLGDNGLVNKAKEATTQTQVAMDRELLLSAVVGAMGNDGKVNLSAIVLPEGFTGSNGTYTSKNGNAFSVSENGEIVYTAASDLDEGAESVDLNGKYYYIEDSGYDTEMDKDYVEIINNSVFRYGYYDSLSDTEEILAEFEIGLIDKVNKICELRYYYDENNLDKYETFSMPYMLIEENGKIINKALSIDGGTLVLQNEKGKEYGGISGVYYTEDGTKRITFDSSTSIVNSEVDYGKTGNWSQYKEIVNEKYFIFDGFLIIDGEITTEYNDFSVVNSEGDTYYKQDI